MDSMVLQAMAKWPSVADCYGWLGLDSRGRWRLRDATSQALGAFSSGRMECKGAVLTHQGLIEFIARNYSADRHGRWYFQNGPQRVYVELESTPWIWRLSSGIDIYAHTGQPADIIDCLLDQDGKLYLYTNLGCGLLHTQDVPTAANAIECGKWHPILIQSQTLQSQYNFVLSPAVHQGFADAPPVNNNSCCT